MMPEQQQRILGYFIEEAKDHLNTIEQGLLNLQATIQDSEMVNEVFRAAHSVKGGAAMLSLGSIQRTAHRLEDYFKSLKEAPTTQVDRDLESMFLQVFDGLQALLEELQGPFGLTEDKAQEVMTDIEPVFEQLETHLNQLVANAPAVASPPPVAAAAPASSAPPPAKVRTEDSALKLVFSSDVPSHLREMLTLFKQTDNDSSRQALQACCETLKRIGEQFDLTQWCELTSATGRAVGNVEQTYRALAPVVIKELKQAQEQVLAGQAEAIAISAELEALIPITVAAEDDLSDIDSLLDDALSNADEPDLAELFATEAQSAAAAEAEELDWLQIGSSSDDSASSTVDESEGVAPFSLETASASSMTNNAAPREPAVGAAELNSLADLFEGEMSGLDSPWEEMAEGDAIAEQTSPDINLPDDFSDLLDESLESAETGNTEQDLADLFGDTSAVDAESVDQDQLGAATLSAEPSVSATADAADFDEFLDIGKLDSDEAIAAAADSGDDLDALLEGVPEDLAGDAAASTPADESPDWGDDEFLNLGLDDATTLDSEVLDLDADTATSAAADTDAFDNLFATADTDLSVEVEDIALDRGPTESPRSADATDTAPVESFDETGGPWPEAPEDFGAIADPWSTEEFGDDEEDNSALDALDELWSETQFESEDTPFDSDALGNEAIDLGALPDFDTDSVTEEAVQATDLEDLLGANADAASAHEELNQLFSGEPSDSTDLSDWLAGPAAAASEEEDVSAPAVDVDNELDLPAEADADELDALFEAAAGAEDEPETAALDLDELLAEEASTAAGDEFNLGTIDAGESAETAPTGAIDETTLLQSEAVSPAAADLDSDFDLLSGSGMEAEAESSGNLDDILDQNVDFELNFEGDEQDTAPLIVDDVDLNGVVDETMASESEASSSAAADNLFDEMTSEAGDAPSAIATDAETDDDFFDSELSASDTTSGTASGESDFDLESALLTPDEAAEPAATDSLTDEAVIEEFFDTPAIPPMASAPTADSALDESSDDNLAGGDIEASWSEELSPDEQLGSNEAADLFDDINTAEAVSAPADSLDFDTTEQAAPAPATNDDSGEADEETVDPGAEDLFVETAAATADEAIDFGDLEQAAVEDAGLDLDFAELDADNEAIAPDTETDAQSGLDSSDFADQNQEVDFEDLDALLMDDAVGEGTTDFPEGDVEAADVVSETVDTGSSSDFDELDSLLDDDVASEAVPPDSVTAAGDVDFGELDALLEDEPVAAEEPGDADSDPEVADEFSDLEKLLEEADQTLGGSSPSIRTAASARATRRVGGIVDQTMRVSVKHLDNLNNLVGELVVNRNSLEQDQDRLRQFLDNLLFQVQQLNDVGQRMRDLYERSLLESSLLASRQAFQSGSVTRSADSSRGDNGGGHATGATFDALEMDRFTGFHTLTQEMVELIVRVRESASDIAYTVESTDQIARQFRQVTTQLQEGLNKARMVPFAQTADRLPRAVRDISIKCGKEARLVVEGRDTLIDKMILERLYDPMTHLVNNAITHGIESPDERAALGKPREGTITVRAFYQGNQTVIYIADDGGGINADVVKQKAIQKGMITQAEADTMNTLETYELLFRHGFSTRDQADDFAGRGVGMDVVRTALSEIRGSITIDSELGKGTSFTIRLPLTLSISKALSCLNNQARIAFPMDGVEDMFDVPRDRIQTDENNQTYIQWRDTMLTFQPLSELLQFNRALGRGRVYGGSQDEDMISIVVLRNANTYIGIQVDRVLGEQEIVIKQIEGPVPKPMGIAGATVLGDGRVMPIGDVLELIDIAQGRVRREAGSSLWSQVDLPPTEEVVETKAEPTVLIVDDSITVRELLSMSFNKVGYRVEQARDGQEAWEKMRSGLPCDLVFCDIEMPRMDGLELLSRMQKDSVLKQIPIAMLTSRGADRHRQMAVDLGASGYFTKPYLEEALLDAAQRMLNGEVLLKAEEEPEEV